jgi:amidase
MVQLPSPEQLREVAEQCGLSLSEGDLASFRALMVGSIAAYNTIDALPDELPEVKYPRTARSSREQAQGLAP